MKGARRARPIRAPWIIPIAEHTASGTNRAGNEPHREAYAVRTAARASIEPTDRSMPPEMMTKVIPMAMIARKEAETARLEKFCRLAKLSPNTRAPPITVTTNTEAAA